MHHDIILRKDQKHVIPGGVIEKAISLYKTGFGVSVVDSGGKLVVRRKLAQPTVEQFINLQMKLKDSCILMSMTESEETLLETDVQPFTLLTNKEGEAQLVGYFDGGFDAFHINNSTHTNEYLFVENHFRAELVSKYEEAKGDIKKFMDLIRNPEYMGELKGYCAPSNSILLHSVTGEVVTVSKDKNVAKTPWGWTSSLMGMSAEGESAQEEKKEDGLGDIFEASPPPKETVVEPPKEGEPGYKPFESQREKKDETLVPHPDLKDMVGIKPPSNMVKGKYDSWYHNLSKRLKETYGIGTGTKPSDWKETPVLFVPRSWADKMSNIQVIIDPKKGETSPTSSATSVPTVKVEEVKPKQVEKSAWEVGYPVFNMQAEAELIKLSMDLRPIMTAEMWKALENKYKQFPEVANIKGGWMTVIQMTPADVTRLVKESPEGAVLMIINLLGKMNQQKDLLFRTRPASEEGKKAA